MGIATPNPSLATMPEVVANGGLVPARLIDAFAARTIYASTIPGVVLDCDLDTGLTASGGAPTDNASRLNAVLAAATATAPVHLVIDGGTAMGTSLVIPQTGHVTIEGLGWDTGFFMLAGSTSTGIQNYPHTDLAACTAWNPGSDVQSIAGSNVILRDFRLNMNRLGPNSNGTTDGTLANNGGSTVPTPEDQRGPYANAYWLTGIELVALEKVLIDNVWVYDSPSYGIDLYHCTNVAIDRCRIESPSRSTNTDGLHANGGCRDITVYGTWFGTGDDAMAVNLAEGDGTGGGNITFADCYLDDCLTAGLVYGQQGTGLTQFVTFRGIKGTCRNRGIQVGYQAGGTSTTPEINHLTRLIDWDVAITSGTSEYNSLMMISASAGVIELVGCVLYAPNLAFPMVLVDIPDSQSIGSIRVADCSIHRNDNGAAAASLLSVTAAGSTIGDFHASNFRVTELFGSSYADIPALIGLAAGTIGRITFGGTVDGVGTLIDIGSGATVGEIVLADVKHSSNADSPASTAIVASGSTVPVFVGAYNGTNLAALAGGTVTLTGPGVLASGYPVADSIMGNNSPYIGSGHSNNPCIKLAGTAHTINYT